MTAKRIIIIVFTALALAAASAASASASEHEFSASLEALYQFKIDGSEATLASSPTGQLYNCTYGLGTGYVTGPHLVTQVSLTLHGCIGIAESKESCPALSTGATPGFIVIKTLKGELGTVKTSEAGSGVGLVLEPVTGTELATLEAGSCTTRAAVTGSVTGEVLPIKQSSFDLKLPLNAVRSGLQAIKEIAVLGTRRAPELRTFGGLVTASLKTGELLLIVTTVEVT
jgi:hypothetical protein